MSSRLRLKQQMTITGGTGRLQPRGSAIETCVGGNEGLVCVGMEGKSSVGPKGAGHYMMDDVLKANATIFGWLSTGGSWPMGRPLCVNTSSKWACQNQLYHNQSGTVCPLKTN